MSKRVIALILLVSLMAVGGCAKDGEHISQPGEVVNTSVDDIQTVIKKRHKVTEEDMKSLPDTMKIWETKDDIDESKIKFGSAKVEIKDITRTVEDETVYDDDGKPELNEDGSIKVKYKQVTTKEPVLLEYDLKYNQVSEISDKLASVKSIADKYTIYTGSQMFYNKEDGTTTGTDRVQIVSKAKEATGFEVMFVTVLRDDDGRGYSVNFNVAGLTDILKTQQSAYEILNELYGKDMADVMVYQYYDTVKTHTDEDPYDRIYMNTVVPFGDSNSTVNVTRQEFETGNEENKEHRVIFNINIIGIRTESLYTGKYSVASDTNKAKISDILGKGIEDSDGEGFLKGYLGIDGHKYNEVKIEYDNSTVLKGNDGTKKMQREITFSRDGERQQEIDMNIYEDENGKYKSGYIIINGVCEPDVSGKNETEAKDIIIDTIEKQFEYFAGDNVLTDEEKNGIEGLKGEDRVDVVRDESDDSMIVVYPENIKVKFGDNECTRRLLIGVKKTADGNYYGTFRVIYNSPQVLVSEQD